MLHNVILGNTVFRKHLEKDEQIVYIGHVHYFMLFKDTILFALIGILLPLFLFYSKAELYSIAILIFAVSLIGFLYKSLLWFYDCWVITNKGVIDILWHSFFDRKVIRIPYLSLDGVSTEIKGFWNTMLKFGNIYIIVHSGEQHKVELFNAYNPTKIEAYIMTSKNKHDEHRNNPEPSSQEEAIKEILAEMISKYAEHKGVKL